MSLLEMSLAGGAMIVVITVVRALTAGRLPRATFTVLWAVAALRLLVPVSVPSAVSVYTWLAPAEMAVVEAVETVPALAAPAISQLEMARTAPAAEESVRRQTADQSMAAPAAGIPWREALWAAGAALFGAYFAACWLAGRRRFREAVEVEDEFVRRWQDGQSLRRRVSVRLSGRVDGPVTYGLFRPVILLPAHTDWRDTDALAFILAHEYAHIRRMDGMKKLVLTVVVCLHWFNPAVWVMYLLANRDMELACDERVVRSMAGDVRAAYARTLIRMAEVRGTGAPMFSWFSANAMEERIISIMKMKKLTAWAVILSLVLTLGVTAVLGTSALAAVDEPETPAQATPEVTPTPVDASWYMNEEPQYVWDLTSGTGVAYEARPAAEADHLLDIQPYGYRTAVNFAYLVGGQSVSAVIQPGREVIVGRSDGTFESLVIAHGDGRIEVGQRSADGQENPACGDGFVVQDGSIITGRDGWTPEGGTELFVRNTGDEPISIDAFLYETE